MNALQGHLPSRIDIESIFKTYDLRLAFMSVTRIVIIMLITISGF